MDERSTSDARNENQTGYRCGFGTRCVNAEVTGHDPDSGRPIRRGAPVSDDALCKGCMTRLAHAVTNLPQDYGRLAAVLGDSMAGGGDKVHLTREAALPINTATEALMSRIVESSTRAAEMVAVAMNMDGRAWPPQPYMAVSRASKILAQTLRVLLVVEPQTHLMWGRIPSGDEGWDDSPHGGQPTELVEVSGLDMAKELVEINRLVGVQLGKARLRHHYSMPCPAWDNKAKRYCGAFTIGQDDGSDRINCSTCGTSWTEEQYGVLEGLVLADIQLREENDMLRFLLAEAYWRLDTLRRLAEALADLDVEAIANDGPEKSIELFNLVGQQIVAVLTMGTVPHSKPEERNPATQPNKKRAKAIAAPKKEITA